MIDAPAAIRILDAAISNLRLARKDAKRGRSAVEWLPLAYSAASDLAKLPSRREWARAGGLSPKDENG